MIPPRQRRLENSRKDMEVRKCSYTPGLIEFRGFEQFRPIPYPQKSGSVDTIRYSLPGRLC